MAREINSGEWDKPGRVDVHTIDPRAIVVDWKRNLSRAGTEPPVDERLIGLARDMMPRKGAGDAADGSSGQLNPVVCRMLPDRRLEIISGFRRLRAALYLIESGECTNFRLKATVSQMSDAEAALTNVVENVEREDPKPIELAHAVRSLHEDYGMDMDVIAKRLKRSPGWLERIIGLTALPSNVQQSIVNGQTSVNAGLELATMDGATAREVFSEAAATGGKVNATTVKEAKQRKQRESKGESAEPARRTLKQLREFLESRTGPADSKKARDTSAMLLDWLDAKKSDRQINEYWDKL